MHVWWFRLFWAYNVAVVFSHVRVVRDASVLAVSSYHVLASW